jgi:hypothetical protein
MGKALGIQQRFKNKRVRGYKTSHGYHFEIVSSTAGAAVKYGSPRKGINVNSIHLTEESLNAIINIYFELKRGGAA